MHISHRFPAVFAPLLALLLVPHSASAQAPRTSLDTITVVGSRTTAGDGARVVQVLTRAEIARSAATNIGELLAFQLGIDVYGRSAAQADISLRGSTSEQTLILVDGVRVSDVQSSHYALDLAVPLGAIERIELLRGGGSALYGTDAVGGVINIVTRKGSASTVVAMRGGSFGTFGGSALSGTSVGSASVSASGEYQQSDGYRTGTDYQIGQGRVALNAPLGSGHLDASLGIGIRDFGANTFYGPYNSVERTGSTTAQARWVTVAENWALSTTASSRRHTDHFTLIRDNPSVYQNDHTSWQHSGEFVARTSLSSLSLALGASADLATLRSARLGDHDETRAGGFGEVTVAGRVLPTLTIGLRADHSSTFGGFLSPSLGMSKPLSESVRLHASASRGLRAPTWTERYYVDPVNHGTANLAPEEFWSGDLGIRVAAARGSFDVTGFARRAENLIDWVKPAGAAASVPWVATNVGDATYRGVEASATLAEWHRLTVAFTGSLLSFSDDQGTGLSGKYALRPIDRQLTAHLRYAPVREVQLNVEILAARRATENGYVTGNSRLTWEHQAMAFMLDITNVTNARWLDASGIDVAGRTVYFGARWTVGRMPRAE